MPNEPADSMYDDRVLESGLVLSVPPLIIKLLVAAVLTLVAGWVVDWPRGLAGRDCSTMALPGLAVRTCVDRTTFCVAEGWDGLGVRTFTKPTGTAPVPVTVLAPAANRGPLTLTESSSLFIPTIFWAAVLLAVVGETVLVARLGGSLT